LHPWRLAWKKNQEGGKRGGTLVRVAKESNFKKKRLLERRRGAKRSLSEKQKGGRIRGFWNGGLFIGGEERRKRTSALLLLWIPPQGNPRKKKKREVELTEETLGGVSRVSLF